MFEVLSAESGFGLISEHQVSLTQRSVAAEVPALSDLVVAQQVCRHVRSERNCNQRIEQFFGFFEVRIGSRHIQNSELGELPKQREVGCEMVYKFREAGFWPLKVRECHHRRRSDGIEKHRELVGEVAKRRLGGFLSVIDLRRQKVTRNFQLVTEKTDFFRLGFQVPVLRVEKHKIEDSNAALNVFDLVLPPVVLAVNLAVEPAGVEVVDDSALWEEFGAGMLLGAKLVPESGRALAPMCVGESQELTRHKVA